MKTSLTTRSLAKVNMANMDSKIKTVSQNILKINLKPEQVKVIDSYLAGKDTVFIAPTGFGKSIVYQLAPFLMNEGRYVTMSRTHDDTTAGLSGCGSQPNVSVTDVDNDNSSNSSSSTSLAANATSTLQRPMTVAVETDDQVIADLSNQLGTELRLTPIRPATSTTSASPVVTPLCISGLTSPQVSV